LICFICFVSIPPKKAEAIVFLPFIAMLAPEVIPATVEILISAGVIFTSLGGVDGIKKTLNEYAYTSVGQAMMSDLDTTFKAPNFNGILDITDSIWNNVKTWVSGRFGVGSNIEVTEFVQWGGYPISPKLTTQYPYQLVRFNNSVPSFIELDLSPSKIYCSYVPFGHLETLARDTILRYKLVDNAWVVMSNTNTLSGTTNAGSYLLQANKDIYNSTALTTTFFNKTLVDAVNVIGDTNINDMTRDWLNDDTNSRAIPITKFPANTAPEAEAVTSALNQWVNKTGADVIGQTITKPVDDVLNPPADTVTFPWLQDLFGWFKGLLNGIKAIPIAIISFFTIDWFLVFDSMDFTEMWQLKFKPFYDVTNSFKNIGSAPVGNSGKFYMTIPTAMGGDGGSHCFLDFTLAMPYLNWARIFIKWSLWAGLGYYVLKLFEPKIVIN